MKMLNANKRYSFKSDSAFDPDSIKVLIFIIKRYDYCKFKDVIKKVQLTVKSSLAEDFGLVNYFRYNRDLGYGNKFLRTHLHWVESFNSLVYFVNEVDHKDLEYKLRLYFRFSNLGKGEIKTVTVDSKLDNKTLFLFKRYYTKSSAYLFDISSESVIDLINSKLKFFN